MAMSEGATRDDEALVTRLLGAVGTCFTVAEWQLDAVTSVSGSGPAYAFMMIEAMADGGVKGYIIALGVWCVHLFFVCRGLQRDVAIGLAAQTLFGAAKMVLETGKHPAVLRDQVSSPAGTTIAATGTLEQRGFRSAVISAIDECRVRSIELGKPK